MTAVKYLMEQEIIEVIPLAYMRGRTLNQAFIILDEAQNSTVKPDENVLTRMGEGPKSSFPETFHRSTYHQETSGLRDAVQRLQGISGIGFIRLQETDIVRHPLVQKIVRAYDAPGHSVKGIQFEPPES
ncbi:MAG: PhoH family protein [Pirellulales bacterium]